jgi:putative peptide zinc metalloprotease protein
MTIGAPRATAADLPAAGPRPRPGTPRLVEGVELLGEYQGSGYAEPRYLVRRADQQVLLMPRLAYLVLRHLDGRRDLRAVTALVSAEHGQRLGEDGARFLLDHKLAPLGLVTEDGAGGTDRPSPRAKPLLALNMRSALIPARVVRPIARLLAPLHLPAAVAFFLAALVALDCWLFTSGHTDGAIQQTVANPRLLLATVTLAVASLVFHEFGHASGCHYGGARPGPIGAGLYVLFPCFYTNVTDSYRLSRAGRLRTDLGGVYFNAIFIVAMGVGYLLTGFPPLLVAAVLGHAEIIQQLPPLVRMDGYYILADLVGVPDLFGKVRPILRGLLPGQRQRAGRDGIDLRPGVRRTVTVWVLLVVPLLLVGLVLLVVRLPEYLASAWNGAAHYADETAQGVRQGEVSTVILALLSTITIALPWVSVGGLFVSALARLAPRVARLVPRVAPALDTVRRRLCGRRSGTA